MLRSEKTSTISSRVHEPGKCRSLLRKHFLGSCARKTITTHVSDKTPRYSSNDFGTEPLHDVTRCLSDIYYF